jgi:dihydrofolate reductase
VGPEDAQTVGFLGRLAEKRVVADHDAVTGDAVAEITRLKAEDGGPMSVGGATLAGAAMRAGLIDEYAIVTHPVLVGGGTPFFTALDNWVNLNLVETRTFPDGVLLTRYETSR